MNYLGEVRGFEPMSAWAVLSPLGANEGALVGAQLIAGSAINRVTDDGPGGTEAGPGRWAWSKRAARYSVGDALSSTEALQHARYSVSNAVPRAEALQHTQPVVDDEHSVASHSLSQASTLVGSAPGKSTLKTVLAKLPSRALSSFTGDRDAEAELRQEEHFVVVPIDEIPRQLFVRSGPDPCVVRLAGFLTFEGETLAESVWVSRPGTPGGIIGPECASPGPGAPVPGAVASAVLEPGAVDEPPAAALLEPGTLKTAMRAAHLEEDQLVAVDGSPVVVGELHRAISIPNCLRASSSASDTNECAVCLEPLEVGTTAALICGHMFHKACIAQSEEIAVKDTGRWHCPSCRCLISHVRIRGGKKGHEKTIITAAPDTAQEHSMSYLMCRSQKSRELVAGLLMPNWDTLLMAIWDTSEKSNPVPESPAVKQLHIGNGGLSPNACSTLDTDRASRSSGNTCNSSSSPTNSPTNSPRGRSSMTWDSQNGQSRSSDGSAWDGEGGEGGLVPSTCVRLVDAQTPSVTPLPQTPSVTPLTRPITHGGASGDTALPFVRQACSNMRVSADDLSCVEEGKGFVGGLEGKWGRGVAGVRTDSQGTLVWVVVAASLLKDDQPKAMSLEGVCVCVCVCAFEHESGRCMCVCGRCKLV